MANPEHLAVLQQGVEVWNRWRLQNPEVLPDLSNADMSWMNLSHADLSQANLTAANLHATQMLAANLSKADLTGACIQDWNVNAETRLQGIACEYIYLKQSNSGFEDRRPNNDTFSPDDFSQLIQQSISMVELIFSSDTNWQALATLLQKFQIEPDSNRPTIGGVENNVARDFAVRLDASSNADRLKIQELVAEGYNRALRTFEEKYRTQLQLQENQLIQYQQENTNLWEMIKLMASRPIDVNTNLGTEIRSSGSIGPQGNGLVGVNENIFQSAYDKLVGKVGAEETATDGAA